MRLPLARLHACSLAGFATGALLACASLAGAATAVAATLKVNTTTDQRAPHGRKCSLREAIAAVDAPGTPSHCGTARRMSNTIVLRAGRYRLSIAPSGGDDNASGDLNVTGTTPLTITGAGRAATVIDASGLGDRVLSIAGTARVRVSKLAITGGHAPGAPGGSTGTGNLSCATGGAGGPGGRAINGGGIYNSGTLILNAVAVTGNAAGAGGAGGSGGPQSGISACSGGSGGQGGSGGGIYNRGRLTLTDSTIRANRAGPGGAGGPGGSSAGTGGPGGSGGPGGTGGGIYNQGNLSVTASTIYGDRAGPGGPGGPGGAGISGRGVDGAGGPGSSAGGILSSHGALRVTNSTLVSNFAGAGGAGGGLAGNGGAGGSGGAILVSAGASTLLNATVADNGVGAGGAGGSSGGSRGASGSGGGLFVLSSKAADDMKLENTIVASSLGSGCAGNTRSAIVNGGHDLSYGDKTCPGKNGNPKLGTLRDNGGPTETLALGRASTAINRVPTKGAHCPAIDQRGVHRAQGKSCDTGAFEFAVPRITIIRPGRGASYERGSRILTRFRCSEGGIVSPIATCKGSVRRGHAIDTRSVGTRRFRVTATDKSGHKVVKTIHYTVWAYVNPLGAVSGLSSGRIDMGVDYAGSGPLLALGDARVTAASNNDSGPLSCWGISCWPGGGVVVYRLTDGPFAGKYVYDAENITATVHVGQKVKAGEQIAILHFGSPNMETGWASGRGVETLSFLYGHQCTCTDPGGWSAIEGRNFNQLLIRLGAPSGSLQPSVPNQSMPRNWPRLPASIRAAFVPRSRTPLAEGATVRSASMTRARLQRRGSV